MRSKPQIMDPREREALQAKKKQHQELLDRAFDRVIGEKLTKLSNQKIVTGTIPWKETRIYKRLLCLN